MHVGFRGRVRRLGLGAVVVLFAAGRPGMARAAGGAGTGETPKAAPAPAPDSAAPGDRAAPDSVSAADPAAARPFTWQLGFTVRPFIGVDTASGTPATSSAGFLVELHGVWYVPRLPMSLRVTAGPAGFGFGGNDRHRPGEAAATLALETDYVAVGLGGGLMWGVAGPCFVPPGGGAAACESNTGATFNQTLRLGTVDGFSFAWRSSVIFLPDGVAFGLGQGKVTVPLTRTWALWARVGAGDSGWFAADLGVRTYLWGVGARGTVVLDAGLGYASLFDGPSGEVVGGPALTFGMEWRL